jgi:hypothetical protein
MVKIKEIVYIYIYIYILNKKIKEACLLVDL